MTRKLLTSLFAISSCAAVVVAQAPQPTTTQAPATVAGQAGQSAMKADSITVEGCVQRSAMAASSTTGATGTAGAGTASFILEKAAKPSAATGATAASSPVAIASTYRLDADEAKLSPHVGHKVEITGTVDNAAGASTPPATSAASAANAPKLKVDAVKMIAANCTP